MADTIIYLDHAATSPLLPEVLDAMMPWLREGYGNPGSLHRMGRRAQQAVYEARDEVAALIGAQHGEIIFTSGGTESDNLAIAGTLALRPGAIVTSPTEHHAVLEASAHYGKPSAPPVLLPVDSEGRVALDALEKYLVPETALVSVMHGNNETGVVQPVEEIGQRCRDTGIPFHCDGVQSAGHIPVDVIKSRITMYSLSAHKLGGPKGVGALYLQRGKKLAPQLLGGGQEWAQRAGTENVAGIVGFAKACTLAREALAASVARFEALRHRLEEGVRQRLPESWINSGEVTRLPHISNIGFAGLDGEGILYALDTERICVSTGSACTSGVKEPSHVLTAMGQPRRKAHAAVRFSIGVGTTEADIDRLLNVLPRVVQELRAH